jgi:ADP-ribose pyrophosphatase YjhB (NUDIX family)
MAHPRWLTWAQQLQALAQSGLTYTKDPYDVERYQVILKIAAEMVAAQSDLDLDTVVNLYFEQSGYITPKLDGRGVVFKDDHILLVKDASAGTWTLPGGWVDVNEPPGKAVEREVWEESGYRVRAVKLLALYDRNLHGHPPMLFHTYKIFILCELVGGEATTSLETSAVGFFSEDQLPVIETGRTTVEELHRFFAHRLHPEWQTDFD